ncbi:MAG: hypothetical protein R3Y44_07215 [Rikenellaceae bacterium]
MKIKYITTLLVALSLSLSAVAQVSIEKPDLSTSTKIAPDYFGPNALPIPDMLDGTTSSDVLLEIGTDYFDGHRDDKTYDLHMKLVVPLFSERVNVTMWVQSIVEYYQMSDESHAHSRLSEDIAYTGYECGDAYLTTDIHMMKQTAKRPDITLRIGLKTALGYGFFKARYFDNPGYFFDTSVAKSFSLGDNFFEDLRLVGTLGFLCWQTDNGRQNDAVMYGAQAKIRTKWFTLTESFGGYSGWERDGDCPMSIKSEIRTKFGHYEPYFQHQYGFRDWPFTQYKLGVGYRF